MCARYESARARPNAGGYRVPVLVAAVVVTACVTTSCTNLAATTTAPLASTTTAAPPVPSGTSSSTAIPCGTPPSCSASPPVGYLNSPTDNHRTPTPHQVPDGYSCGGRFRLQPSRIGSGVWSNLVNRA